MAVVEEEVFGENIQFVVDLMQMHRAAFPGAALAPRPPCYADGSPLLCERGLLMRTEPPIMRTQRPFFRPFFRASFFFEKKNGLKFENLAQKNEI